jgi:hypothetical protein
MSRIRPRVGTAFIRPFFLISRLYISIGIQKIQVGGKRISTIIPFKLPGIGICNLQIPLRYKKPAPTGSMFTMAHNNLVLDSH